MLNSPFNVAKHGRTQISPAVFVGLISDGLEALSSAMINRAVTPLEAGRSARIQGDIGSTLSREG